MTVLRALGAVLLRFAIAVGVSMTAAVMGLFLGFIGGNGRSAIGIASFVAIFALGWSLLPAVRVSSLLAILAAAVWSYLGYRLSQFGDEGVRGWMLGPWILASLALIICLVFQPPLFVRNFFDKNGVDPSGAKDT